MRSSSMLANIHRRRDQQLEMVVSFLSIFLHGVVGS